MASTPYGQRSNVSCAISTNSRLPTHAIFRAANRSQRNAWAFASDSLSVGDAFLSIVEIASSVHLFFFIVLVDSLSEIHLSIVGQRRESRPEETTRRRLQPGSRSEWATRPHISPLAPLSECPLASMSCSSHWARRPSSSASKNKSRVSGVLTADGRALTNPIIHSFLYAHKFNSLLWHDVNKPEHWGFASLSPPSSSPQNACRRSGSIP